jgi:hypothetical protein
MLSHGIMKKTFFLRRPGLDDARVLESVRLEIRKYVKRERRKTLPEGFTLWTFGCRVGPTAEAAVACEVDAVVAAVETLAARGEPAVYVEILAAAGNRPPRAGGGVPPEPGAAES